VYYRGPIARRIVEYAAANRGSLTKQDFEEYRAYVVEPLETRYRNWTVYNTGLHSQGMVMTLALNLLRGFPLSDRSWDDPETIHLIAEATKLAHIDKYHYVGDPAFVDVPLERLLSHDYADRRRRRIDPEDAIEWPEPGGLDGSGFTSTFSLVDANGNGAAVTASVGAQFVVAGDTGIVMNQRVKNMQLEPGNPNVLAPGKRVRHTVNPYIAVSDDGQVLFGGNTGYDTQSQGQIQQFLHVAEFGANVQQAVSRPRYIVHAFPDVTYPHEVRNVLALESYYDDDTVQALRERGHRISRRAIFGNAAAVLLDTRSGRRTAGADPRGENLALAR
jgi:gamma-glutamyltranspeptidase/glutathione hydrolase